MSYNAYEHNDLKVLVSADYNRESIYEDADGNAQPFYVSAWKSWIYPGSDSPNESRWDTFKRSLNYGILNVGSEVTYANTLAVRAGYLLDNTGSREELDLGLGIYLSQILQMDIGTIRDLTHNEVRQGQLRFSLLFKF